MSELLTALNRLNRAGSESGRATQKLHEAAKTVANEICVSVYRAAAIGVKLPRGYRVRNVRSNIGNADFLLLDTGRPSDADIEYQMDNGTEILWIDGTGGYLHGDFNASIPDQTREGSLRFAKDTSEGLLNEIAEFLETRATACERAKALLDAAK